MTQTAAPAAATQFEILEEKIHRTLELVSRARAAREEAEREAARLRAELADKGRQVSEVSRLRAELAEKARQLSEAERERAEMRRRIERLLKQIDALAEESLTN